jgi:hypothetical protein
MAVPGNAVSLDVGTMLATWLIALGDDRKLVLSEVSPCGHGSHLVRRALGARVRLGSSPEGPL